MGTENHFSEIRGRNTGLGQGVVILCLSESFLPREAALLESFISLWRFPTIEENKCNGDGGSQGWKIKLNRVRSKQQLMDMCLFNFLLHYPPNPLKFNDCFCF